MTNQFYAVASLILLFVAGCTTTTPSTTNTNRTPDGDQVRTPGPSEYEVFGQIYEIMPSSLGYVEIGIASWYGTKFHGRPTAIGEIYDMYLMTAAHKSLPLPTMVKVTNLDNGRSITLRVNDRGPFHDDRVIDLSYGAAKALGFEHQGTAPVVVEAIDQVNYPALAVVAPVTHAASIYLQVGAFMFPDGAEKKLNAVREVIPSSVPSRILESETETGIFYKVWVGPIESDADSERIAGLLTRENLGNPLRVQVD